MAALDKTKSRDSKQGVSAVRQYVTFSIGEELFGIDVIKAQEILNLSSITKVPNTMPFMKGVIDLRGKIVPLIDMRLKFGLPERPYDKNTVIIIAQIRKLLCGLIVDSVSDVVSMTLEDIQNTPHFAAEVERDAVTGIGKVKEKLVIVLNADKILTEEEVRVIGDR
jgi:purine-binding chemotaxis protein CheW